MNELAHKGEKKKSQPIIVLAGVLLYGSWLAFLYPWIRFQFWQPDTFWLIETGRLILEKHCLPSHDTYSFTASAPQWLVYQWLTEILFSLANSLGGLAGVAVFGAVILAVLFCVLIFRKMINEGSNSIVSVVVIWLAAYAFFPYLSALRPQLLSFVLFWLLATVCAAGKSGLPIRQALIRTFLIGVVWANCHVSFPIGLVMIAANLAATLLLYLRQQADRKLPILFAAMLVTFSAATLVTPHGISLWMFMVSLGNLIPNPELQPLAWSEQPQLIALVVITFAACWYRRKKIDIGDFLVLVALLLAGNKCGRLIVYFCIFCCPVVGQAVTDWLTPLIKTGHLGRLSESVKSAALTRWYVPCILLLATFVSISQPVFLRSNLPVQAAKFLEGHPLSGHLFCDAQSGSYLIYTSHGAIPVFLDTRLDLYDRDFVLRFIKALNLGDGWQELFSQYKIAAALIPNDRKLKEILDRQTDWKPIYRDPDFSLYVQNGSKD
jgi:hypothetical protein